MPYVLSGMFFQRSVLPTTPEQVILMQAIKNRDPHSLHALLATHTPTHELLEIAQTYARATERELSDKIQSAGWQTIGAAGCSAALSWYLYNYLDPINSVHNLQGNATLFYQAAQKQEQQERGGNHSIFSSWTQNDPERLLNKIIWEDAPPIIGWGAVTLLLIKSTNRAWHTFQQVRQEQEQNKQCLALLQTAQTMMVKKVI